MPHMKVVRVHDYGGPDALVLDEVATPAPKSGECLVEVKAAGVNFFDTQLRSGAFRRGSLPVALGLEGAGVVTAVHADVRDFKPGDRVAWIYTPGSYGTHTVVMASRMVRLPEGLDFKIAAAGIYQGMTAHYLGRTVHELKAGDTCVVHSCAGGVGQILCQIAKLHGATVFGTVSSDGKVAAAKAAGADHVIVYTRDSVSAEVKRLTGGKGTDVVYDAVGLETWQESMKALRPRGMLAFYGEASGDVPPLDVKSLLVHGSIVMTRTGLDHFITTQEEFSARAGDILRWLASGELKVEINREFPLDRVADAHRAIEGRGTTGKILIVP